MLKEYVAVLQAGGQGSRLKSLTGNDMPKPMLPLNGKPMLEWQIENLKKYGICEYVIICGYLGNKIKEYFKDGSDRGIHIIYIKESEPLGSAGALYYLKKIKNHKHFVLVYGDIMFDVDMKRMVNFHEKKKALVTLLVHPNSHPTDSDLVVMENDGIVQRIVFKKDRENGWYHNCVNAGIYIFNAEMLDALNEPVRCDMEKDLLALMLKTKRVYGYRTTEYVKDAGTVERFYTVVQDQKKGLWSARNLENHQKCVFLDRDGTVTKYKGLISKDEDLELEEGAAEAIRILNHSEYLAILVTNQPVVARGLCDIEDVHRIHRKLETLLGEQGAYLDDIIFCPHHPERGFPEENLEYKISCGCRKPATGMIDEMVNKYHISGELSFMVGDSTVDVQTGINAGIKTILVNTGQAGNDSKYNVTPNCIADNLLDAVRQIML